MSVKRIEDAEDENKELRAQLREMVDKLARLEETFAQTQSKHNEIHINEMEVIVRQHVEETESLREERDQLSEEVESLKRILEETNMKLDSAKATAAYATSVASKLETESKDAQKVEFEAY
ncbi:hypothetical protein HDV05_001541, partial [Chytridiales sp. JEL 0842]